MLHCDFTAASEYTGGCKTTSEMSFEYLYGHLRSAGQR